MLGLSLSHRGLWLLSAGHDPAESRITIHVPSWNVGPDIGPGAIKRLLRGGRVRAGQGQRQPAAGPRTRWLHGGPGRREDDRAYRRIPVSHAAGDHAGQPGPGLDRRAVPGQSGQSGVAGQQRRPCRGAQPRDRLCSRPGDHHGPAPGVGGTGTQEPGDHQARFSGHPGRGTAAACST